MDFVCWAILGSLAAMMIGANRVDREIAQNAKKWGLDTK
jgi:hypothetical protein